MNYDDSIFALRRYDAVGSVGILLWQEPNAFAGAQIGDRMLRQSHGRHDAVLHRHVPAGRLGVESRLGHLHDHTGR